MRAFEQPEQSTEAFGELLRGILEGGQFPALARALERGAFAPREGTVYLPFDFGLEILLDGVERHIERSARNG